MKLQDYLLALVCVILWGLTFPVIKGVSHFVPGVFLTACRFLVIALPALFISFPSIGAGRFMAFSLLFGCGQYLLSALGIYYGLSAGLAAVIMQIQVFITIGLAHVFLKEKAGLMQVGGIAVGFIGVASFLMFNTYFAISLVGLVMVCIASCSWAGVNMIVKTSSISNFTALVAWGAVPNIPVLFAISYGLGEFNQLDFSREQLLLFLGALVFLGLVVTFAVSVFWNGLLKRYSAIYVTPFSLLIPVVGLSSSWLIFADTDSKQIAPVLLIFIGLAIVIYSNIQTARVVAK